MSAHYQDKEVEQYRSLLETPEDFQQGFGWTTITGIFFCGLVMMPGSIYLGLMTGGNLGGAASWVTVILFMEVARRALEPLSRGSLVTLLHAARVMMAGHVLFPGGPFGHVVYRAYLVSSEAIKDAGMSDAFPGWYVPSPESAAILERNLFHPDWWTPIFLLAFLAVVTFIQRYTLGYFFFRITSDIENLPFPMAPIAAQGTLALAEAEKEAVAPAEEADKELDESAEDVPGETVPSNDKKNEKPEASRWQIFTIGVSLGIFFGFLQVGIPAITGLFLDKPFFLIPQPFIDTTTLSEGVLPATPTGVALDLGIIILGFVLPFWSVVGTFIAILITLIFNPVLHQLGVLQTWQPGMDTVNTAFANNIDFWLSFGIGSGLGIAAVSIYSTFRDIRRKMRDKREEEQATHRAHENFWKPPVEGRGDFPMWLALGAYIVSALAIVICCYMLLGGLIGFLLVFAFLYTPFISYVNARLLGIAGQEVEIPFLREGAFILSGADGVDIWLAPVPIQNYANMTQQFRVNELTGVNFNSLLRADIAAIPVMFLLSFAFWAFIWKSDPVPSQAFPYAQVQWEYKSKNDALMYSATFESDKPFMETSFGKAFHPEVIGGAFTGTVILYTVLSAFGMPVMLVYGMIRGFGQFPHIMVLEIVGALLSRFYFQRKYGSTRFLKMAPAILAGYFTGVGLMGMGTLAIKLIKEAVSNAPF